MNDQEQRDPRTEQIKQDVKNFAQETKISTLQDVIDGWESLSKAMSIFDIINSDQIVSKADEMGLGLDLSSLEESKNNVDLVLRHLSLHKTSAEDIVRIGNIPADQIVDKDTAIEAAKQLEENDFIIALQIASQMLLGSQLEKPSIIASNIKMMLDILANGRFGSTITINQRQD